MKALSDVRIDITELDNLIAKAKEMENYNPACRAINYWSNRMNLQIREVLKAERSLPYGYVGSGWPNTANQQWSIDRDKRHLFYAFAEEDWDTRDMGDAVYQANTILDHLPQNTISVVDIGGGYGRLAIPFLYWAKNLSFSINYYSVDYIPESILIAPQVVNQIVGSEGFQEVPTWELSTLKGKKIDVFISIHSFQEMDIETVNFYVQFMKKFENALFYSVNIWPTEPYVPDTWELQMNRGFPINRDGSYAEKLWRIK